jgi:hypothetical protein
MGEMETFDGCPIIDAPDRDGVWILQPKLLHNLKANFNEILNDTTRVYRIPSAPKTLIILPRQADPLISPERQNQL